MPGLCQSRSLEVINLACNGIDDRASYLLAKVISAQSERRDNVVWSYSLRGEVPPGQEDKRGLKSMILSHNALGDPTASELVLAIRHD